MPNAARKLGLNIRRIRLENAMTQGDLCKKLKMEIPYLSNVENGKKNPTIGTIERVAKALGVKIEDLIRGI